jgi:hypothetical protein
MFSTPRAKAVTIVLVALVVTAMLWVWADAQRKRELSNTVASLVEDTSLRVRDALSAQATVPPAESAEIVRKLDDHAAQIDKRLQELRAMDGSLNYALVDAADGYVLTARELVRKLGSSYRYRLQLSRSVQALNDHMLNSDRRSKSWVSDAVRAKDQLEKDYFGYKLAVEAFGHVLETYPETRAKMAPYVDTKLLVEEGLVKEAREQALGNAQKITEEIDKLRQLSTFR